MHDAHEARPTEITGLTDKLLPVLKHMQADQSQLDLRCKAVVHPHQCGRSSATPSAHVILVNHDDRSRLALCKMKRDRSAHYARAKNDDVCRLRERVRVAVRGTHAAASCNRPF